METQCGDDMNISSKVDTIFLDSLFTDEEIDGSNTPPEGAVLVEGIVSKFGFHPERLATHKDQISDLIKLMPEEFSKGGGWSFLNLCMDKDGNQWGEHRNMEQLVALAIATEQGKYVMPREMWSVLPGGMPYIAFTAS